MDFESDDVTRAALGRLIASGDLLDLAHSMRARGVESLLMCRPDGRIERVITDWQVAQLGRQPGGVGFIPSQDRRPGDDAVREQETTATTAFSPGSLDQLSIGPLAESERIRGQTR